MNVIISLYPFIEGVAANVQDCNTLLAELEIQSLNCVQF